MSTVSATGGVLSAQSIWNRFITGLDRDKDGQLSVEELAAMSSSDKAEKAMSANDANGDGRLGADELPKGAFSPVVAGALLNAQEYHNASPDERRADDKAAIAEMFARADIDGNGVLSQSEWDVERALSMSRFLDSGESPDIAFIARNQTLNGLSKIDVPGSDTTGGETAPPPEGLRPEDFVVGRKLNLEAVPIKDLPDDLSARLEEMQKVIDAGIPGDSQPPPVLDHETMRADMMAKIESTPMDASFLTRLIMSLGETAGEASA